MNCVKSKLSQKRPLRRGVKGKFSPFIRVPRDFPWRLLNAVLSDLQGYLTNEEYHRVDQICRKRNLIDLMKLSEDWGLRCMNQDSGSVAEISARYQLAALLKKFPFVDDSIDRRMAAKKNFIDAESSCRITNEVLIPQLRRSSEPDTLAVMTYARSFILRVLGQIPDWDIVSRECRHGPGATLSTSDGRVCSYYKYENWPYDVTKAASPYAITFIQSDERWLGALEDDYRDALDIPKHQIIPQEKFWANVLHFTSRNSITFVPKDALKERTIAIEPVLSLFLQLGVDGLIRSSLKGYGVDLDKGQLKNQQLARRGSVDGEFSTIDMKAASDTLSLELCHYMLPPVWYNYLMALRSPQGVFADGGDVITYNKISSMGNGFTFALESLVFTAMIYGVSKHYLGEYKHHHFAVYGDDLIVRTEIAGILVYYLKKIGFTVNHDKSFFSGPIRESCGTDWFKGHLIRPVFLSDPIVNLMDLFSIRNRIKRKMWMQWGIRDSKAVSLCDSWVPDKLLSLVGPNSHEEFSTYRHIDFPFGRTRKPNTNGWEIKTVFARPARQRGHKLFFRRLMNPLRDHDEQPWIQKLCTRGGLKDVGGCYQVTRRARLTWGIETRVVLDWPPEY